ncbi:MAG TPA: D-glycero-beta-D-manno-heptose-7-phosphate kinase [Candidatus Krumholzibacteria bacterium]|nr:D-glycero-beta-D-manno-heptose-7-phosphate kinase [Candidatus Krumholzibacteria bacterium]HRX50686.1 D-glycero-beta-D-manno-heptose-7-phosphate kinase [Candidatus Krumholzibacteria bacterium]
MLQRNLKILDRFADLRLLVVGDAMVDRFLWGEVHRISPEAPVPVVRLRRETAKLGGAANVAANLRALGARTDLIAVAGTGETSKILAGLLEEEGIDASGLVRIPDRRTTLKTRIIAHQQQVVRADVESDEALSASEQDEMLTRFRDGGPYDGVILSDYGKGVLTDAFLRTLIDACAEAGTPVVIDPKRGDYSQYRGCTSITPNQKEAAAATAIGIFDPDSLQRAGRTLLDRVGCACVLITRGEHGMALYERDGDEHHLPTEAREVFDVTGAGDTVIAVYTAALAAGASFLEAANLANHAAGLAVRELGTVAVTADQIREALGA